MLYTILPLWNHWASRNGASVLFPLVWIRATRAWVAGEAPPIVFFPSLHGRSFLYYEIVLTQYSWIA